MMFNNLWGQVLTCATNISRTIKIAMSISNRNVLEGGSVPVFVEKLKTIMNQ